MVGVNVIDAGKEVFVEILLILHLFVSTWVYCLRGSRPFLYCNHHIKNTSYFFADYLMDEGMEGGMDVGYDINARTMVRWAGFDPHIQVSTVVGVLKVASCFLNTDTLLK